MEVKSKFELLSCYNDIHLVKKQKWITSLVVDSTILVIHNYFNVFHMYKDEIIRKLTSKKT